MDRQLRTLFLLISSLFGLSNVAGENQKPSIEQLHSKLANLAKLQYGYLLPHEVLNQFYTQESNSDSNSEPLLNPANLLPHDLYNHGHSESESEPGEESENQRFENVQKPAVMQINPVSTATQNPVLDSKEPISPISILDMEKSLMEEAGIMSLGDLEYDSENRQFEFLPQLKSSLHIFSDTAEEMFTRNNFRTGNQHEYGSSSSGSSGFSSGSLPEHESHFVSKKDAGNLKENVEGDITLELNPNGSDLEFIHANSHLKTIKSIPNFSAQIFTLSYGGEKKPVLIIQPAVETSKTKNSQLNKNVDGDGSNSNEKKNNSPTSSNLDSNSALNNQQIEEMSIPNFIIRFPLETNSQFQIPRYNFTLPTLFLPGLVFTQNENTKTNTHEVHVSVPQSNDIAGIFPLPPHVDNPQVIELLPHEPRDSLQNSINNNDQQHQNRSQEKKSSDSVPEQSVKNLVVNNTEKAEGEKHVNSNIDIQNIQEKIPVKIQKSPEKNIQGFETVYKRLFESGKTSETEKDCQDNQKESSDDIGIGHEEVIEEDDPILCGSDGLCGVTCHRLGFHHGKCVEDDSCVCIFKQRPEFGLKLDFYVDKRARGWENIYPIYGFCHRSSCKINCERAGYITGFCEGSCFCGTPWVQRSHRNETQI